jgi:23S rRNA (cytidine1920-2'-O)/16S rRNA (cytidine1409-2'-O)-methyltransferase
MRSRLDLEIARRGLATSREAAQRLIMAGRVRVNSRPADKADLKVDERAAIAIIGAEREYASRAAYKLIAALDYFGLMVKDRRAIDVGASTGGFTDVLLRRGAAHVIAIDVGYGQLAEPLRIDPRVTVMDRTNVRYLRADDLPYQPDLAVIDTSFISLKLVIPSVLPLLTPAADIIALIKPQFEVGKDQVGRGGIVRDADLRRSAVQEVINFGTNLGLYCAGWIESPITGAAGNHEFLIHFALSSPTAKGK